MKGVWIVAMTGLSLVTGLEAVVIFDESLDSAELSGDYLNPTPLVLGMGANLILGSVQGNPVDRDLFTLTVPDGLSLAAIRVVEFSGADGALSFMGAQPGAVLSDSPIRYIQAGLDPTVSVDPINYVLFGAVDADTDRDVMPQLVVGPPMNGASPLPPGQYAFWLNETRALTSYTLNFEVIPEPNISALVLLAFAAGVWRRVRW